MLTTKDLAYIEYDKNRDEKFGIKSAIVYASKKGKEGAIFPILYISKPKHISQEEYEHFLDKLELSMNK